MRTISDAEVKKYHCFGLSIVLQKKMIQHKFTARDLAARLGVDENCVLEMINGQRDMELRHFILFTEFYGDDVNELLNEINEESLYAYADANSPDTDNSLS